MIIRRCAWHREYFHRPRWLGLRWEPALRIIFSDGLCPKCARRFRAGARVSAPQTLVVEARRQLAQEGRHS